MKKSNILKITLSGLFLALAIVLPFITAQIPSIGNMLSPIHLPIFLCAYFVGPLHAGIIGFVAPIIRSLLFGVPVFIPKGISMAFELLTYGISAGLLYKTLPKRKISIYISLVVSMLLGRLIWGFMRLILFGLTGSEFGLKLFIQGGFITSLPGIIIQLIIIPTIVMIFNKYTIK